MRTSCLICYKKHVSQAIILLIESRLGYPEYVDLVVGHLAEAESESVKDFKELAMITRDERLKIIANLAYDPDLMGLLKKANELLEGLPKTTRSKRKK